MTKRVGAIILWTNALVCLLPGCQHVSRFCQLCTIGPCKDCDVKDGKDKSKFPDADLTRLEKAGKKGILLPHQIKEHDPANATEPTDIASQLYNLPGKKSFQTTGMNHDARQPESPYYPWQPPGGFHEPGKAHYVNDYKRDYPVPAIIRPDHNDKEIVSLPAIELPLPPQKEQPKQFPKPNPPPQREPLVMALELLLDNQHDKAMEHLKAYDADRQEVFLRLLPIMAQLSHKNLDDLNHSETAVLYDQLDRLMSSIRSRSELTIERMCFCEHIEGYGKYIPLPKLHAFRASSHDQPGERVQVYVQFRNLCSEPYDGRFITRLASVIRIIDQKGEVIWYKALENGNNPITSQSALRDFFRNYIFNVPRLPPGDYSLVVEVRDLTIPGEERSARQAMPFRVGL